MKLLVHRDHRRNLGGTGWALGQLKELGDGDEVCDRCGYIVSGAVKAAPEFGEIDSWHHGYVAVDIDYTPLAERVSSVGGLPCTSASWEASLRSWLHFQ